MDDGMARYIFELSLPSGLPCCGAAVPRAIPLNCNLKVGPIAILASSVQ